MKIFTFAVSLALLFACSATTQTAPFDQETKLTADVAGMCDQTGRVFGLMPHPERFINPTQHPQWTRLPKQDEGAGLQLFRNAVRYFS